MVIIRYSGNSIQLDFPTRTEHGNNPKLCEFDNTWLLKSCLKCTSTFPGPGRPNSHTRCSLNFHRLYSVNFKFKIYLSGLGQSPLSSAIQSYPLPPNNNQTDYPPATYWPYIVNFKLHLFFPGGGVGNNQT